MNAEDHLRRRLWIITGACGFLGSTLVEKLLELEETVRAVDLKVDAPALQRINCQVVAADVTVPRQVEAALEVEEGVDSIVVHCAGVVSIAGKVSDEVQAVNVSGTANVIDACRKQGVTRLVYVSSVHAIPEPDPPSTIAEIDDPATFRADRVVGEYAQTKAEATALVLAALDLDRVVVHPSGLIGPGDYLGGHLTTLVDDAATGKLSAVVGGGYDFVDVRDVADGIIAAAELGRTGHTYLLTGHYVSAADLADKVRKIVGKKRRLPVLPTWFAKMSAPMAEIYYKLRGTKPLYTKYSLHTLESPSDFSHARATRELGYHPRPLEETLRDTVEWMGLA